MIGVPINWRLRTLAFAALALAVFGAIECPPAERQRVEHKRQLIRKQRGSVVFGWIKKKLVLVRNWGLLFAELAMHWSAVAAAVAAQQHQHQQEQLDNGVAQNPQHDECYSYYEETITTTDDNGNGLITQVDQTHGEQQQHADQQAVSPAPSIGFFSGLRSETPPEGYSVFLSYERSTCKTAMEHPRVPFSNASLTVVMIDYPRHLKRSQDMGQN